MATSYRYLMLGTLAVALAISSAWWSGLGLRATDPKPSDLAFEHLRQRLRNFQTLRVWTTMPWARRFGLTPLEAVFTADREKGAIYDSGGPRYLFDGMNVLYCYAAGRPIETRPEHDAPASIVWEAIRTGFDNLVVTDQDPYDAGLLVRPTGRTGMAWRKLALPDLPEVGAYLAFDEYAEPIEILTFGGANYRIGIHYAAFDLEIEEGFFELAGVDGKPTHVPRDPITIADMNGDRKESRRLEHIGEPPLYDFTTEEQ